MGTLSRDEIYLLDWLAKEDGVSPLMIANAPDVLDRLVVKGLVEIVDNTFSGRSLILVTHEGWRVATGD